MTEELSFSSKIDLWLLFVMLGAATVCVVIVGESWNRAAGGNWLLTIVLLGCAGLPLWILATTRYFLSDDTLRVRCGPFRMRVPIADITKISPTRNPLSSPALSLDRLRIDYGKSRSIMISPEPREEFLRQLEYRRQQLAG